MFAKSKVSQSMIDAVNKVLGEEPVEQKDQLLSETAPLKEPTSTGMRVYGGSYGNSAKAKKDQTKSPVDNLKGPKDKEMKEGREFTEKLLETVRKSDVPAYLRKAKGDTPLTVADVKAPKKDSISAPENLAKNRNEEVEQVEEADKLLARTGMNLPHKFPRTGQTNLGNIPGMNTPGVSKETGAYAEKRRGDRAKELKPAIKSALGTHGPKGKLPEEFEQVEEGKFNQMDVDRQDREAALEKDGWKKMPKNVKDKGGNIHTPMSRARDLARSAFNKIKSDAK